MGYDKKALLTAIAFHVSQVNNLPKVGYLVTADKFFLIAYVAIFLSIVLTTLVHRRHLADDLRAAARLDRIGKTIIPAMFFATLAMLIFL